jgi:alpha-mannosidase
MRQIDLVAHTHWDREWYLTFERFRDKLIETLDLVLDCLAHD